MIFLYVALLLAGIASSYTKSTIFCGIASGTLHYMSLVYVMLIFTECLYYVVKLRSKGIRGSQITGYLCLVMLILSFGKSQFE